MRKFIGIIGICLLIFSGCATKRVQKENITCQIDGESAPKWVCKKDKIKGMIIGVGSADPSPLNFDFQKSEAVSAAKDAIIRQIGIKLKDIFKKSEVYSGVKKEQTAETLVENMLRDISYQIDEKSKLLKSYKTKKGTIYVLVGIRRSDVVNCIKNSINNKIYKKYLSKKSLENLDNEIDKKFNY